MHNITDADGEPIMDPEHIAYLNPFRYRSYYYDTETRLYYLQTRYYDPEVCRFISQDDVDYAEPEVINGINLYAYCGNNPVMNIDPTGTSFTLFALLFTMLIGAIMGGVASYNEAVKNGLTGWSLVAATFGGAIFGAAASGAFMLGGAAFTTGLIIGSKVITGVALFGAAVFGMGIASTTKYLLDSYAYDNPVSLENALMSFVSGSFEGVINFIIGGLAGKLGFFNYSGAGNHNYVATLLHKPLEAIIRGVLFSLPSSIIRGVIRDLLEQNK